MSADSTNGRYAPPQKLMLLDVARRALNLAVIHKTFLDEFPSDQTLPPSGGAFVTLHRRGRLRGCIGRFATAFPLAQVVAHCAAAAACDDPRFHAVQATELREIEIEISVLSEPMEIRPDSIEIGRHGLIVTSGRQRGVLLPHVAVQYNWDPTRFLEETCAKAGLDRNAWTFSGTHIEAFTAETFSEAGSRRRPIHTADAKG